MPAIKHSKMPVNAKEISQEEFEVGRKKNIYKKIIQSHKEGMQFEEGYNLY